MKKKYIMALDQGTTSARCILYDRQGRQISVAQKEFRQIYPHEGWVEHDPMDIWSTQIGVAQEALLKTDATYEEMCIRDRCTVLFYGSFESQFHHVCE